MIESAEQQKNKFHYWFTRLNAEDLGIVEAVAMFEKQNGLKGVQLQFDCSHKKEVPLGAEVQDVDKVDVAVAQPGPVIVGEKDPDEPDSSKRQRTEGGAIDERQHYDQVLNPEAPKVDVAVK